MMRGMRAGNCDKTNDDLTEWPLEIHQQRAVVNDITSDDWWVVVQVRVDVH